MAKTVFKNAYVVCFQNGTEQNIVADSARTVANVFETDQNLISVLKLARLGVEVVETDIPNPVTFTTIVTPSPGAGSAGCLATPTTFSVEANTPVIFQATVGTGYAFTGWFISGVLQSSDLIASIAIPVPAISGQSIQVEARFVVSP